MDSPLSARQATPGHPPPAVVYAPPRTWRGACLAAALPVLLAVCATATAADESIPPEGSSGYLVRESVRAHGFMAATANPLATDAAFGVLARGGTAVDAVVAAQMMLTLVEPQSSGIGGGAFLLTYEADSGRLEAWDGREAAPMAADEGLFLDRQGQALPFFSVVVGGRAVGVPGVVRMLEAAHRELGMLPWSALLQPAIDASLDGFAVSPRLHALISKDRFLRDDPAAEAYFHDADGRPLAPGARLRNPALAESLRSLAENGARDLYSGGLAASIVAKVRNHPHNPGLLTLADLAAYQARRREPVCAPWLRWIVCGMPPPSSGGIAVAQILGILQALSFDGLTGSTRQRAEPAALDPLAVHYFSEAGRLAYADRDRHVADSDYVEVPGGLLDDGYLRRRAALVGERSMGIADPDRPPVGGYPEGGTSHVSVVDSLGNAAALTTSLENGFGSRQMVGGFLLNNQLTDFSFTTTPQGAPDGPVGPVGPVGPAGQTSRREANRVQPGKRPRSSMAPTLVFEQTAFSQRPSAEGSPQERPRRGRLVMVTGSPGGASIINYVAKALVATLQDGLDPGEAIALPNVGSRNGPTELERGLVTPALRDALRTRGHVLRETEMTSGLQSIVRRCDEQRAGCAWIGAADPRREGTARGN